MNEPSARPRVLIFSLQYHPFIGGAEVAIKEITDRIQEIEFHMVTLRFNTELPRMEKIGNVIVHRIGFARPGVTTAHLRTFPLHLNKHLYQFLAVWKASMLHRTLRFSATWAMMAHSTGIPAGVFKSLNPKVGYLLTLQEGDPPEHVERLARPVWPLFVRAFTKADLVQAISNFLADWARRRGARNVEVVPNAVETSRFALAFTEEERAKNASRFGKREGEIWLVTISRLVHKNAVDTVIRAMSRMPSEVVFVVGGMGPDETMLRELAHECGVADRVRFLGHVDQKELPSLLSVCDIFTRPSRSEGLGISFIEAMAAGLPIVATRVGGIQDFLTDGKTGWAVDVEAPEQIVDAVRHILSNPVHTKSVVAAAKGLVLREYDWNPIAAKMKGIFRQLIG